MFSIQSVSSDREFVFSSHGGEYFHVELKGIGVTASTDVWATTDGDGLNRFFQELARHKTPWKGEHRWESLEGEFEISATCTTLGHVVFLVKLAGQIGGVEEWQIKAGLDTELGQLEKIAQNARIFFKA